LQVKLKKNQNILIVTLQGELDHHEAEKIRDGIEYAVTNGHMKHLIFDFSGLSFMDSSGIGMVIGRYKLIQSLGGRVALICNGRMRRLVEMSGLARLVAVCESLDDACQAVKEG